MAQGQTVPSGFYFKFVNDIDAEYICTICHSVLRSPVQTKCGHKFCKDCLTCYHRHSGNTQCPIDRTKLNLKQVFEDKATERKILSFIVHCPNEGCGWQGELRSLLGKWTKKKGGQSCQTNHLDECPMTKVECSYKQFGCTYVGPKKSQSDHVITAHLALTTQMLFYLQEENKTLKEQMNILSTEMGEQRRQIQISLQEENKTLKEQMNILSKEMKEQRREFQISLYEESNYLREQINTHSKQIKEQRDMQISSSNRITALKYLSIVVLFAVLLFGRSSLLCQLVVAAILIAILCLNYKQF